ncbi:DUF2637 domain-containing protein [Rhodococcus globerulus]|uniref:Uncharacterized protein DUF2637 n=1 Tax=Nocardia globerula TaxID=1818 RepID=A0A652YHS7_NOCGL|nr:DUF2637 domain-containing protein [Rhodococcus globerulus]NMD64209.1 DUF2637 domain-containing protein [Nocardia globerula]
MNDFSLRAARIQLGALLAALVLAILIALGITTGAFVLSFAVQRDLAIQATIPEHLAWIFPVIVDGAILGSTIAIVLISKLKVSGWDKGFYIALAVFVVLISILGNAYHAFNGAGEARATLASGGVVGYVPLEPAVAALIAIVPPLLVLAFTHGCGVLIKATGVAYADYRTQIDEHAMVVAGTPVAETNQEPDTAPENDFAVDLPQFSNDIAAESATAQNPMDIDHSPALYAPEPSPHAEYEDAIPVGFEGEPELDTDTVPPVASEVDLFAELEQFIAQSDLPGSVKETARRKLKDPSLTWEAIAQSSNPPVVTSTAWRRYERFDTAARAAGFTNPPLFDMRSAETFHDEELASVS